MVQVLFVVTFALGTLCSAYELPYKSVLREGLKDVVANVHSHWRIRAGQDSGEIIYPKDYACSGRWGPLHPPDMLSVSLVDADNALKIVASTDLKRAYIYRATTALHAEATVELTIHCRVYKHAGGQGHTDRGDEEEKDEHDDVLVRDMRPISGFI